MTKLMQPIASEDKPMGTDWVYEVKYDGFRCVLHWEKDRIRLVSRNNTDLTGNFPEIVTYCGEHLPDAKKFLPLQLDGEIAILNNPFQANFPLIQQRGRLKNKTSIQKMAIERPASFLAFDCRQIKGSSLLKKRFLERKKELKAFFQSAKLDTYVSRLNRLCYIPSYTHDELQEKVFAYKGEGIVAKRKRSMYQPGKQHRDWLKIKNWRVLTGILTFYDTKNDYFNIEVFDGATSRSIGKCKHGLKESEYAVLKQLFRENGEKQHGGYSLPPAVCAEIHSLDLHQGELREPSFKRIIPSMAAAACTLEKLKLDMAMLPSKVEISKTDKVFWPNKVITKGDLLVFMREISPYMLPFLNERILTVIRCPDGVEEEYFFQKHLPDYAPDFIKTVPDDDEDKRFFIVDRLESLIWFANHGAIEYHVPFQKVASEKPAEIVFDLDPPDRDRFPLAVHAATLLKQLLDGLELMSFVKTSGGKGLQVHIPIPENSLTYGETGIFTQAIAQTLVKEFPAEFTTERMKKKRGERLYIDYVQHGKDKTLIAPYSPRKTDDASVATPLFWDEVKDGLTPDAFTIANVLERVQLLGCPFAGYFVAGEQQRMDKVLELVKR